MNRALLGILVGWLLPSLGATAQERRPLARRPHLAAGRRGFDRSLRSRPAALQALAAGRELRLAKLGADHDRYGRLVAFAFAGEAQLSVQEMLLQDGQAHVSARVGDKACADALLAAEPRRAPPGAGCGPIPILPLWRRKIVACRASGVILRWRKARSCRCTTAAALYM